MENIEELKGMTQNDLVRRVQELEESLLKETEEKKRVMNKFAESSAQIRELKDIVKKLSNLI